MQVFGYTETGAIKAVFSDDGAVSFVPDDMGNRYRQAIAEWEDAGNTIPAYVAPSPTPEMLTDEVNRRLSLGFDFDFKDERGVHHFGTTPGDMTRWMQEVTPLAQAAMNMGEPDRLIGIKTNTGLVEVKASEWWLVLDAAAAWRQPLYAAYFTLKAMDPIPADYATNSAYWP